MSKFSATLDLFPNASKSMQRRVRTGPKRSEWIQTRPTTSENFEKHSKHKNIEKKLPKFFRIVIYRDPCLNMFVATTVTTGATAIMTAALAVAVAIAFFIHEFPPNLGE